MNGFNYLDLYYILPEIIFLLVGVTLLFLRGQKNISFLMITGGVLAAIGVNLFMFNVNKEIIFNTIEVSDLSILLRLIILVGTLIFIITGKEFADSLEHSNLYYGFLSFATIGMIILPASNDLLTLYIAFELTSISTYSLPFIDQKAEGRFEAGIKYYITGAFSSGLILFGMSYLFGMTGSLYLKDIAQGLYAFQGSPIIFLAFAFIIGGLSYKMALAPFHLWAPDTYTGSPSPISGYLAGVTKKGAFAVSIKLFLLTFAVIKFEMTIGLAFLAILTMTVGNLAALMQDDVKRMIAFSSVANAGTILVGYAVGNLYGLTGSILHILAHLLMTVGAFMVIYYVGEVYKDTSLQSFAGLSKKAPMIAFAMTIFLLSLGGIPPFLGFWSKMVIIFGAVEAGGLYFWLAVALILNSALSLAYYFKIAKYMYIMKSSEEKETSASYFFTKSGIYLTALLLLISGLIPGKTIQTVIDAVQQFLG